MLLPSPPMPCKHQGLRRARRHRGLLEGAQAALDHPPPPDEAGAGGDPGQSGSAGPGTHPPRGGPDPLPALGVAAASPWARAGTCRHRRAADASCGLSAYSCWRATTTARSSGCPGRQVLVQAGGELGGGDVAHRQRPPQHQPGPPPAPGSHSSRGSSRDPRRPRSGIRRRTPAAATGRPSPGRSGPRSPTPGPPSSFSTRNFGCPSSIVAWPLKCRTSKYPAPYEAAKRSPSRVPLSSTTSSVPVRRWPPRSRLPPPHN